jgi:hypothetical protein
MNKDQGIIKDRYELIFKELQNILAFGYLCLIIIGMIYEAIYYSFFGINIFEYSEILDFLLAPFRRPLTLIYLVIAIVATASGLMLDKWFRKWPKLYRLFHFGLAKKPWFETYRIWATVATFVLLIIVYGVTVGGILHKEIMEKSKPNIEIRYSNEQPVVRGKSIGKNGSFIFLLNPENKVQIIPINNDIQLIQPLD